MTARHITAVRRCRPGAALRALILGAALIASGAEAARAEGATIRSVIDEITQAHRMEAAA